MKNLGITHIRLDERLIHGQVATLWIGSLGVSRVMVIDDNVVTDELTKASLKTAVPAGVKLSILKVSTAFERLMNKNYSDQKVLIIVKDIATIFKLVELGLPISSFNLGNSSPKEGDIQVTKSVFLSPHEIKTIQELEQEGMVISAQMVPMEEIKKFTDYYRGRFKICKLNYGKL